MSFWQHYPSLSDYGLFYAPLDSSGVAKLASDLVVNSTSVSPAIRYEARNISGTTWSATVGGDLSENSTGAAPTPGGQAPFTDTTESVSFAEGDAKYYVAANTTLGDISTEDFVLEFVFKTASTHNNQYIYSKRDNSGSFPGWFAYNLLSGAAAFGIDAGTNIATCAGSTPLDTETWYHVICFFDNSDGTTDGMQIYVNGSLDGSATHTAGVTATSTNNLAIGALHSYQDRFDGTLAYCAMWKSAAWFAGGATNTTQWGDVASERFARLCGVYPRVYAGSPLPTFGRTSKATLETRNNDGYEYWHNVGFGWPRILQKPHPEGGSVVGFIKEDAATNMVTASEDFSLWTTANTSVATSGTCHVTGRTATRVTTTAGSQCYIESPAMSLVDGYNYAFSVLVKAGTAITITASIWVGSSAEAYFNLQDGYTKHDVDVVYSDLKSVGNGWYRCSMLTDQHAGTDPKIRLTVSDIYDAGFDGSQGYYLDITAAQLEEELIWPTTYIQTLGAEETRVADSHLEYSSTSNINELQGKISVDVVKNTFPLRGSKALIVNDGYTDGTADDEYSSKFTYVLDGITPATAYGLSTTSNVGAESYTSSAFIDLTDGYGRTLDVEYGGKQARLYINNHQFDEYKLTTQPSGFAKIFVGMDNQVVQRARMSETGFWVDHGENNLLFKNNLELSGISNLPLTLKLGTAFIEPVCRYEAKDISGASWTAVVGGKLPEANSGVAPVPGKITPFTDDTRAVKMTDGGMVYTKEDNDFGQISTEDFAFELVFKTSSVKKGQYIFSKRQVDGAIGWAVYHNNTGEIIFVTDTGPSLNRVFGSTILSDDTWYHLTGFMDYSDTTDAGMRIYLNGEFDGYATHDTGSLANDGYFSIGSHNNGTSSNFDGTLAYLSLWKKDSWFTGGATNITEWANVSKERFQRLCGIRPQISYGSEVATFTRATSAVSETIDGYNTYLHLVGGGWPRIVHRKNAGGAIVKGYLSEAARTNLVLHSDDIGNAAWVAQRIAITLNATTTPFQDSRADAIAADTNNNTHMVHQSIAITSGTHYVYSVYAKAGNQPWVWLYNAQTDSGRMFNLSTGVVGSEWKTAKPTNAAGMDDIGNGWYRIWVNQTATASVGVSFYTGPADADFDGTGSTAHHFAGDSSTVNLYLFGAQLEAVTTTTDGPSSYIPTVASSATRNGDTLQYSPTGNVTTSGTMSVSTMCTEPNPTSRYYVYVDDGTFDNRVYLYESSNTARFSITSSGTIAAAITGTSDPSDGYVHDLRGTYEANAFHLYFDGVEEGTADLSGAVPASFTRMFIGCFGVGSQINGLVNSVKTYDAVIIP